MNILLPDQGEIEVLGSARHRGRARSRQLPARGARPLQEDDRPPPAPLLRRSSRAARVAELDPAIDDWMARLELHGLGASGRSRRSRRACRRRCSSSPRSSRSRRSLILDEPFSGLDPVNAEVAQGRRARDAPPRHDRRLQHPRHGDRREDVRPHLHDLQGAKVLDGTLDEIQAQYGARHRARADRRRRRRVRGHARTSSR